MYKKIFWLYIRMIVPALELPIKLAQHIFVLHLRVTSNFLSLSSSLIFLSFARWFFVTLCQEKLFLLSHVGTVAYTGRQMSPVQVAGFLKIPSMLFAKAFFFLKQRCPFDFVIYWQEK